ncbi:MAG: phosphoribosylformylglycinamidine synthase subunit PurS [Synechococcus sp. SB0668_bin_15]|nr:phosphoribosylformylglycinamidine synthase subunit PurS [Synechococcus sp. SB0668_bin_15]MXZ82429.1 phosphoribosylformylglycinamidine synthase subunit PurS [Synechococcus sp. SB0666_bin_14]MYA91769.1 phosphoribosylformylglycinamidine synthase subunit PurS [Synechococcus sp. SB0663_bin_10]MYC49618.1 phosphoribosylformylglycinamidine synthase subunit PurS [Synechococcus sp. SB0662_bin_14]MYG47423.1 phosphoribosylformylglycinamidine synthase subunit PurS [Synechococcus sp. SB0675_bin_6]MYJ5889
MPHFHATVRVGLRASVLDPAGDAVCAAAQRLGHGAIQSIRIGKAVEIRLEAPDAATARQQLESLSANLLANPVMETWSLELHDQEG